MFYQYPQSAQFNDLQNYQMQLKEAYDVLSDPKRRRLYDDLGASGLKLVETPSQVNPAELIKNFQVINIQNQVDQLSSLNP
jgi:DnaJ-class molecular chaperone